MIITNLEQTNLDLIIQNDKLIKAVERATHYGTHKKEFCHHLITNDLKFFNWIEKILKKNDYEKLDLFLRYKKAYFTPPIRDATLEEFQKNLSIKNDIMESVISMINSYIS